MKTRLKDILIAVTIVAAGSAYSGANAEESFMDTNSDGAISFQETQVAFDAACCEMDTVGLAGDVAAELAENYRDRVALWSTFRDGRIDTNSDGKVSFVESQRAFRETCCDVDIATFDQDTYDRIVDRHFILVDRWSEFRDARPSRDDEI